MEDIERFNREVRALLKPFQRAGEVRRAAVVLAEILQEELTTAPVSRRGEIIPYSRGLEYIMRAVIHVLDIDGRGDRDGGYYISNRLRTGISTLAEALEDYEALGFKEQEDQLAGRGMVRLKLIHREGIVLAKTDQ